MATVRIVLEAGQSNASAIGDIQSWEALYDYLALRNPQTLQSYAPGYSQGSYGDQFRVPGTFPGGHTVDILGATEAGQFQTANCAGVATQLVKSAVFYNPTPTFLTYDRRVADYPGRFRLVGTEQRGHRITTDYLGQAGGTVATLSTLAGGTFTTTADHGLVQDDYIGIGTDDDDGIGGELFGDRTYKIDTVPNPNQFTLTEWPSGDAVTISATVTGIKVAKVLPMTITRHRTQTQHTAISGSVISRAAGSPYELNVDPPLVPAPEAGEVFDHEHILMADAAGITGPLVLNRQFGGLRDAGSALETNSSWPTNIGVEDRGAGGPQLLRLTSPSAQVLPGMWIGPIAATQDPGNARSGRISYSGVNGVWEQISTNLHGVALVGDNGDHTIQNGELVRLTTTGSLPTPLATGTNYHALNVLRDFATSDIGNSGSAGYITIGPTANDDNRIYIGNEPIRLIADSGGSLPDNLDESTVYYPLPSTQGSNHVIGLATTPAGTPIDFAQTGSGTHTIRRTRSLQLATTSSPTDPIAFDPGSSGSGTHTVVRSTCEVGSAHALSTGDTAVVSSTASQVPGGLVAGQEVFIISDSSTRFGVATSLANAQAGTRITLTSAPSIESFVVYEQDHDASADFRGNLYVTRTADAGEVKTYTIDSGIKVTASNKFDTQGVAHLLVQDERVRVTGTGTPPTGLSYDRDYYIQADTFDTFTLSDLPKQRHTSLDPAAPDTFLSRRPEPGYYAGQLVTMSSDITEVPGGFTPGAQYYVMELVPLAGKQSFKLTQDAPGGTQTAISATSAPTSGHVVLGGNTVAVTADTGDGDISFDRLDSHCSYYVSPDIGGSESVLEVASAPRNLFNYTTKRLETFSGYFNGLQMRCTSGTANNVGKSVMLKHCELDTSSGQQVVKLHQSTSWPSTPTAGDKFVVEPPPVGGATVPMDEWCKLLPTCFFEGRSSGQGQVATVSTIVDNAEGSLVTLGAGSSYLNAAVQFFTTGVLPNGLVPGKTYYVTKYAGSSFFYSATYGGANIAHDTSLPESGTHYCVTVDALGRSNPFPPGFNYPAQFSVPQSYQHDMGPTLRAGLKISSGMTVALRMAMDYGEPVLHVNVAFGGTSIGHKEVSPIDAQGFGYSDLRRQISWAKGEPNGCFARLEAVLRGVKRALDEQGDTGVVELVSWIQGEEDARYANLAGDYASNLRQLKADIRQAVVDAGLYTGKPEYIRWVQPKIKQTSGKWVYASTVNAAIQEVAEEDQWSRWVEGDDLELLKDADKNNSDDAHYSGAAMDKLGRRIFDAWKGMEISGYSEVQVCNLALANLGDTGTITAIRPSDGSRQADLCAQYFDLALSVVLQRHPWDFSIRRKQLTSTASDRTEWIYSFSLPTDYVGVLAVLPEKPADDVSYMGRRTSLEYAIELDANGTRRLYCNQPKIVLRYHAKVSDPSKYSEMFVQALSWKLATMLAAPLIKGDAGIKAAQSAQQMFEFMLQQAAGFDAAKTRERTLEDTTLAEWDRSRGEASDLSDWDRYR